MTRTLHVEVGFDLICPWCLIGLRNLQQALARLRAEQPDAVVHVDWRGVQLLPQAPAAGWPFLEFYRHRLGGEAAVRQRQGQVLRAAEAAGVRIDYSAIEVMPNTADAHRLLAWAGRYGSVAQRDGLLERLLRAYFEDGEDLGNALVLLAHGEAAGFERAAMQAQMQGAGVPFQAGGIDDGSNAGSSGVPYFAVGARLMLSGAQPPDVLLDALREALDTDSVAI
jgi:predicted DsbA family dithiol-disulfide isomerase